MMGKIKQQIQTLKKMGYQDFQLKKICHDAVGETKLDQIPPDKLDYLAKALQSQVSFAQKCQQKFNK